MTQISFASLPLMPQLLANLAELGFDAMTPIQAASLPYLLQGRDVIAQAKTGSGKTAAFGLSLLQRLDVSLFQVQALVLCPTRELADQVCKELRRLARTLPNIKILTLCGGTPLGPQRDSLQHGAHIVVGTPGRIQDHLGKGTIDLSRVTTLVLDEADRMLDMGFADELRQVLGACPAKRQSLLFSATFPAEIRRLSQSFQHNPQRITVDVEHDAEQIWQRCFEVAGPAHKPAALLRLLSHYQPASCVVFCNTKQECKALAETLKQNGISTAALNGDLEQWERDLTLVQFVNQSCRVLVATDVAARGLDIKALPMVINYQLSQDPQVHVHRIGRTGRAGQTGMALSLVTPADGPRLALIEDFSAQKLACAELPETAPVPLSAPMRTLWIEAGRKSKLRPGDVLGALTGEVGLSGECIGKIDLFDNHTCVAVQQAVAKQALHGLQVGKLKGRKVRVRLY